MAENLEGSFCLSILNDRNELYLIKGNNPLSIIHNKELQAYFYASTEQILLTGIINSGLYGCFKKNFISRDKAIEFVEIEEGQILKFNPNGRIENMSFKVNDNFCFRGYGQYSFYEGFENSYDMELDDEYIEQLRFNAVYNGFDDGIVYDLLNEGFTFDEIEEFICAESFQ